MSDYGSDNWIDRELRDVPLPEGLLERLRSASAVSDGDLDRLLRGAPIPKDLRAKLRSIPQDEQLDRSLTEVAVPKTLVSSLKNIPAEDQLARTLSAVEPRAGFLDQLKSIPTEGTLAERISDVPVPVGLLASLKQIPDDAEIDQRVADVSVPPAVAAALKEIPEKDRVDSHVAAVSVPSHLEPELRHIPEDELVEVRLASVPVPIGLAASLKEIPDEVPESEGFYVVRQWNEFFQRRWASDDKQRRHRRRSRSRMMTVASLLLVALGLYIASMNSGIWSPTNKPDNTVVNNDDLDLLPGDDADVIINSAFVAASEAVDPGATNVVTVDPPLPTFDPGSSPFRMPWEDLLVPEQPKNTPEFQNPGMLTDKYIDPVKDDILSSWRISSLIPRGVKAPIVREFDDNFLLKERTWPIVRLAEDASPGSLSDQLRTNSVPLWTNRASFDLTGRLIADGRLPGKNQIRVEDFLAAMDYDFGPVEPNDLSLLTAAGPSPFGRGSAGLLQLGVIAGDITRRTTEPTFLTLLVDVSQSTHSGGRDLAIRDALREVIKSLDPQDRIALVVYSSQAKVLFEDWGVESVDKMLEKIDEIQFAGATSIGRGLLTAQGVARRGPFEGGMQRRIILISDGAAGLPQAIRERHCRELEKHAQKRIVTDVIDVGIQDENDPVLAAFAEAGGGNLFKADTGFGIARAVQECVTGVPAMVAQEAVLRVVFNPKAVAGYRQLGHEQEAVAPPATIEQPLYAGDEAITLHEIWLHSNDEDLVATVELQWRDAATGQYKRISRPISRLQFATSFEESAIPLQQAALAAQAAEILRGSPFAQNQRRDTTPVLNAALRVNPLLTEQENFQDFLNLMRKARKVK